MKKTLAAVAVLGAFAASASADVTVYGKIDLGMQYTHSDLAGVTTSKTGMVSGMNSGSRVGFKGSEKIGDLTVGFNYEGSIKADQSSSNINGRVSQLYVKGAFGEVGFGYYGAFDGATGPYDMVGGLTAGATGWGDVMDQSFVFFTYDPSRLTNAITYKAPTYAGLTVSAQTGTWSDVEYSHNQDRYYAVAADYKAGALGARLVVSKNEFARGATKDDAMNYTAGVNYDFGVAKVFLAGNYYENGVEDHDQYGVSLSASAPVAGGTVYAALGFGEVTAGETETDKFTVGAGYKYPLSKQTYLYTAAGYDQEKSEGVKNKYVRVLGGMVHNF